MSDGDGGTEADRRRLFSDRRRLERRWSPTTDRLRLVSDRRRLVCDRGVLGLDRRRLGSAPGDFTGGWARADALLVVHGANTGGGGPGGGRSSIAGIGGDRPNSCTAAQ